MTMRGSHDTVSMSMSSIAIHPLQHIFPLHELLQSCRRSAVKSTNACIAWSEIGMKGQESMHRRTSPALTGGAVKKPQRGVNVAAMLHDPQSEQFLIRNVHPWQDALRPVA